MSKGEFYLTKSPLIETRRVIHRVDTHAGTVGILAQFRWHASPYSSMLALNVRHYIPSSSFGVNSCMREHTVGDAAHIQQFVASLVAETVQNYVLLFNQDSGCALVCATESTAVWKGGWPEHLFTQEE